MTIGRFAAAAGIGVETVRYYQRRDLLPVPAAGRTSHRAYDASHLRQVRFIRKAQAAGFTLEEIRELLTLDGTSDRARVRELAAARLKAVEARMRELRHVQRSLKHLIEHCDHAPEGAACPIVRSFEEP